jgi:hypothetical protein
MSGCLKELIRVADVLPQARCATPCHTVHTYQGAQHLLPIHIIPSSAYSIRLEHPSHQLHATPHNKLRSIRTLLYKYITQITQGPNYSWLHGEKLDAPGFESERVSFNHISAMTATGQLSAGEIGLRIASRLGDDKNQLFRCTQCVPRNAFHEFPQ